MPISTERISLREFYRQRGREIPSDDSYHQTMLHDVLSFMVRNEQVICSIKIETDVGTGHDRTRQELESVDPNWRENYDPNTMSNISNLMFTVNQTVERCYQCDMTIETYRSYMGSFSMADSNFISRTWDQFYDEGRNKFDYVRVVIAPPGHLGEEILVRCTLSKAAMDWVDNLSNGSVTYHAPGQEGYGIVRRGQRYHIDYEVNFPSERGYVYAPYMPTSPPAYEAQQEQRYDRPKEVPKDEWNKMSFLMQEYIVRVRKE